ncbi:uncharacterized protein [Typha latifolia]|uniref:uncharacterized protein n=1 Tax=Typha latifolia TaxID=4733 RepID=UPI003C2FDDEF
MASVVANSVAVSPEVLLPSYGCLSPRVSFPCETTPETEDPVGGGEKDPAEFEFRVDDDPIAMLPADELFSGGKLVPLHPSAAGLEETDLGPVEVSESGPPEVFSPSAPRCSSRWRELLLRLKKPQAANTDHEKPLRKPNPRFLRSFLHRNTNPRSAATEPSFDLPLLRDLDPDSISSPSPSSSENPPPRLRHVRPRPIRRSSSPSSSPASAESPRMSSSGRVVFQGLERSSSSPGSFHGGGPRPRFRGMERSNSAGFRFNPVCSLRGSGKSVSVFAFGQLFSPQHKKKPVRTGFKSKTSASITSNSEEVSKFEKKF